MNSGNLASSKSSTLGKLFAIPLGINPVTKRKCATRETEVCGPPVSRFAESVRRSQRYGKRGTTSQYRTCGVAGDKRIYRQGTTLCESFDARVGSPGEGPARRRCQRGRYLRMVSRGSRRHFKLEIPGETKPATRGARRRSSGASSLLCSCFNAAIQRLTAATRAGEDSILI